MMQAPAIRMTSDWHDISRRLLSGLWHWTEDNPVAGYGGPDFQLDPGDLPSADHWHILLAIVACHQAGVRPTVQTLRDSAKGIGAILPAPDSFDEIDRIEWAESTSAGLASYAAILRDYGRRRALVAGLLEVVRSTDDVFLATGDLLNRASSLVDRVRQDEHESPTPPSITRPNYIFSRPVTRRNRRRRVLA